MSHVVQYLKRLDACPAAMVWIQDIKPASLQEAWDRCQYGPWMVWLAHKGILRSSLPVKEASTRLNGFLAHTREQVEWWYSEVEASSAFRTHVYGVRAREFAERLRAVLPKCPVDEPPREEAT